MGAILRYLSQRFTMVTPQAKATLNDIGTEELAHTSYHCMLKILLYKKVYLLQKPKKLNSSVAKG